jgi:hypothetical protein
VALALELVLADDEDASAGVEVEVTAEDCVDDDELLVPDEVEETEELTTLAPQTEGTFAAGPTADLR